MDGVTIRDSIGREQSPVVINESGLYSLILSSKLPNAKKFKRWVASEVLPAIRKHGVFAVDTMLNDPDAMIAALQAYKEERQRRLLLESENAVQKQQLLEMKPKVSYYDVVINSPDLISITEIAKDYGWSAKHMNGYEAHRLMYWPSTSMNGDFFYQEKDGCDLDPDELLNRYDDWQDESTWPVSSRQSAVEHHGSKEMADPLTKPGIVGTFCRAYGMADAIDTFLSDIYAPSSMENRYDYIPADSAAGVVIYGDRFAYSHHATDPVCGKLLNAFDLVRLHKFASLDDKFPEDTPITKLPSYKAMSDMALQDGNVKALLAQERMAQAADDFAVSSDWQKNLT